MQATVRTRTRRAPEQEDQHLPLAVSQYMVDRFPDGAWPTDNPAMMLQFVEDCFSKDAYIETRHQIMDRCRRSGMSMPQIACLFDKSERTVQRWVLEMRDYLADFYTLQEVRDIHVERMRGLDLQLDEVQKILLDPSSGPQTRMESMRTSVRLHAMKDQILREAGYYRAFDVNKLNKGDVEGARDADEFARDLDAALLDEVPVLEGSYETGENDHDDRG